MLNCIFTSGRFVLVDVLSCKHVLALNVGALGWGFMGAIDSYSWQLFRLVCLRVFSNSAYQSLNLFSVTKLEL
jgi:hypothetical protein